MSFISTTFDFGTIAEEGGDVSCTFEYKNTGESPLIIITANSSCGCTTPKYSRKPIAAGESSSIEVTYDPMNRPGKFSKAVQIITAPGNKRHQLTITGEVTPRPKGIEELYPFDMGEGLRIGSNFYPMSYIRQGERREAQVQYINTSKQPITVKLRAERSSGLLESDFPLTIAPGASGSAAIAYDLERHNGTYGALSDKYYIVINGKESRYKLMASAHGVDNFSQDEKERPANSTLSTRIIKLGEIKRGRSSSKVEFSIENNGITPLIVRKVDLGEGVQSSLKDGEHIEAGALEKFEIWVDTHKFDYSNFSRYITITTNDPDEPMQRIRVTGIVTK